ncbi:MAG: hypothetical protein ABIQ95_10995, partial [Bdellovibrionia bacterium]
NTAGFYKNIVEPLNSGAELNQSYLQNWESRNSKIRSDRFKIWEAKQFYIVALIHAGVHQAATTLQASDQLTDSLGSRFAADLKKLDKQFQEWETSSHFSQENINPKDQRKRTYGFGEYVIKAREILQYVGQAPAFESLSHSSTALKGKLRLGGSLGYLGGQLVIRSSANALNYLNPFHYIFPHQWRRNFRKVLFRNYTPFNNNGGISGLFKGLREIRGYSVELVGQENLAQVPLKGIRGRKVANLFLPAHRNDIADAILMSRLSEEIGSFLMFANPSAFAGNYALGQMLASLPEFISVGKWRGFPDLSPTEKLIKNLEQERSPNVINYPQGFVSNMGELLPINSSFVQKLLAPLLARGFEVNVIPLSYEVDSKFLSKTGEVDDLQIQARIHPPLLHSTVKKLAEKQLAAQALEGDSPQTRYFDHFLSTLWLESIQEHGELTLDELLERTEKSLGITSSLD